MKVQHELPKHIKTARDLCLQYYGVSYIQVKQPTRLRRLLCWLRRKEAQPSFEVLDPTTIMVNKGA